MSIFIQLLVPRSVHDFHGYDISPRRCYIPFLTAGAPTWPERGLKGLDSMSGLCYDLLTGRLVAPFATDTLRTTTCSGPAVAS